MLVALSHAAGRAADSTLPWVFSPEGVWVPSAALPREPCGGAISERRAVWAVSTLLRAVCRADGSVLSAGLAACALRVLAPGLKRSGARAIFARHRVASLAPGDGLCSVTDCSICLRPGLDTQLPCGHPFHLQCISAWFAREPITGLPWEFSCPLCRAVT